MRIVVTQRGLTQRENIHGGIELPTVERMEDPNKNGYNYVGILHREVKDQVITIYTKRYKPLLESKLNSRSLLTAIYIRASAVIRYCELDMKFTQAEVKQLDCTTRNTLEMHGVLYPNVTGIRLNMKRDKVKVFRQLKKKQQNIW